MINRAFLSNVPQYDNASLRAFKGLPEIVVLAPITVAGKDG